MSDHEPRSTCTFVGGAMDGLIEPVHDHANVCAFPCFRPGIGFTMIRYVRSADNPLVLVPEEKEPK